MRDLKLDVIVAHALGWKHLRFPRLSWDLPPFVEFVSPDAVADFRSRGVEFEEVESGNEKNAPSFSFGIQNAWRLVDEARIRGLGHFRIVSCPGALWSCTFGDRPFHDGGGLYYHGYGDPVEKAICAAFLCACAGEKILDTV